MAFSLFWSLGLIISIIIFAIDLALIFRLKDISNKSLAKNAIVLFISTLILIYFINLFRVQLNQFIGSYNYLLLFLIAFILIFIAYLINKDKNLNLNLVMICSYICFIIMAFMCIVSKQALFGLISIQLSFLSSILFVLIMSISYFAIKKHNINLSAKGLGSVYVILGIYCLIVSLFIPNIVSLDFDKMTPINIVSIESMVLTILLLVIFAVIGLVYYKKNSMFR